MIVICTHKSPDVLKRMVSSIRNFSTEEHKILLVETSDSEISKVVAEEYNCLFTNSELKYEIGAYNHAMNLYPDESEYFMFQDSLEILSFGWENAYRKLSEGEKMVAMCEYPLLEDPCPNCGKNEFELLFNKPFPDTAKAVMCNSFYITQNGLVKLKEFGINKLVAYDKNDTYISERILGCIAYYSCGFADVSTILGEWVWSVDRFLPNTGFTKYINKYIYKRQ